MQDEQPVFLGIVVFCFVCAMVVLITSCCKLINDDDESKTKIKVTKKSKDTKPEEKKKQ